MKYVINLICILLFTWPAVAAGYIYTAITTGLYAGKEYFEIHSDAMLDKFVKK